MLPYRKLFALLLGTASLLTAIMPVHAAQPMQATITAQGSAITTLDPDTANIRALLDALRNVATENSSRLTSHSVVDAEGNLAELISLQSQLDIHSLQIVQQEGRGNVTRVQVAINLQDASGICPAPTIGKVLTTDLAITNSGQNNNHVDINSLLLHAEHGLHQLATSDHILASRINPALNTYQSAMLATEAYHQADFHLTLGAHWQLNAVTTSNKVNQRITSLFGLKQDKNESGAQLQLTVNLSNHNGEQQAQNFTTSINLPKTQSISSQTNNLPQTVKQQLNNWLTQIWPSIQKAINCSPNYVRLSKLIDAPNWRINKGQRLGLKAGQRLLLIPEKIHLDLQDGAIVKAPQVFTVEHVEPNAAILAHSIGQGDITDGLFKLVTL